MFGISSVSIFGKTVQLWFFTNAVGFILFAVLVFVIVIRMQKNKYLCPALEKEYQFQNIKAKKRGLIAEAAAAAIISTFADYAMNQLFGLCFGPIRNNYFGNVVLAPLMIALICYIAGINAMQFTDKIIPAFAVQYCISSIANYFDGCCAGKYWENGIYNIAYGEKQYPAPLYALAFGVVILVIAVIISEKSKKAGLGYPVYVILYSSTRLVTQFFRVDDAGRVFFLPIYTFQCIVCTVLGIVFLAAVCLFGTRIEKILSKRAQLNNTI